jgi:uncharacterized protein YdcH (DUF465 family)
MTSSQQLRENLLQTDEEFRQLAQQHRELDNRLSALSRQLYRTSNEELEKATLKKRKLRLKDQMEDIVRRRSEPSSRIAPPSLQPHPRG